MDLSCTQRLAIMARKNWRKLNALKNVFAVMLFITITVSLKSQTITYYVAPNGNDGNNGAIGTPFKTIEKAKLTFRNHPEKRTKNFIIYLRQGYYFIQNTLTFDENDGGTANTSVTYAAYNGEEVTLGGGKTVSGWKRTTGKNYWEASVSEVGFRQFYVDDKRGQRAKTDYGLIGMKYNADTTAIIVDTFYIKSFSKATDAEIHMSGDWRDAFIPIESVTTSAGSTTIKASKLKEVLQMNPTVIGYYDKLFQVENSLGFLNRRGEWYCDKDARKLYYYPLAGQNMSTAKAIIPSTEVLVKIKGSSKSNKVQNLKFQGIIFSHAGWKAPNQEGWYSWQATNVKRPVSANYQTPAAVQVEYAKNCLFESSDFVHLGAVGLDFRNGVYSSTVSCCQFYDISDCGMSISTANHNDFSDATRDSCNNIAVGNNRFTQTGQDFYGAPAFMTYYVKGLNFKFNEIFDVPGSGVMIGWGWAGFPNNQTCRDNYIENNKIWNYMRKTRDGGGVYTLGNQPGSTVKNNYIAHMDEDFGAIYFDEGTKNYVAENNVLEAVPRWLNIWTTTIQDITVRNNYSTTATYVNRGTNITYNAPTLFTAPNYPTAAQNIINNAGRQNGCRSLKYVSLANNAAPSITIPNPNLSATLTDNVVLRASVTDDGIPGSELSYYWRKVSGPGTVTFGALKTSRTVAAFSKPGTYTIRFSAIDGGLMKSEKDIIVTISNKELGTNLALNKSARASSQWDGNLIPSKAVDGDINTIWHPSYGDGRSYLEVDLGRLYYINRVEMVTRQSDPQYETRYHFSIVGSNDNSFSNPVVLGGQGADSVEFKGTYTLNVKNASQQVRYIRVTKTRETNHTVAELKVFGTVDRPNETSAESRFVVNELVLNNSSKANTLTIFPNPAANYVKLTLPECSRETMHVQVLDIKGNVVMSKALGISPDDFNTAELDVSTLLPGTYVIKTTCGVTEYSGRLLKQ